MSMKKYAYLGLDLLGLAMFSLAVYGMSQCSTSFAQYSEARDQLTAARIHLAEVQADAAEAQAANAEERARLTGAYDRDLEPGTSGSMQEDGELDTAPDALGEGTNLYQWTEQEVEIARLAVHEGSGRVPDTIAITQARMNWSLERLRTSHPRALSAEPTGTRPWIAGLNAELTRPAHWDEERMPWARGRLIWLKTLQTVRRTLRGEARCADGVPQIWGGRMDSHHIERRITQGFRVVNCGATANVFLRRDRR